MNEIIKEYLTKHLSIEIVVNKNVNADYIEVNLLINGEVFSNDTVCVSEFCE